MRRGDRNAVAFAAAVIVVAVTAAATMSAHAEPLPPRKEAPTFPPATASMAPRPLIIYPAPHPPAPPPKLKSSERLGADALHAGDRRAAAAIYADLAARHPENPGFAAAATLLQRPR